VPGCWDDLRTFFGKWHCSFALPVGPITLASHVLSPRSARMYRGASVNIRHTSGCWNLSRISKLDFDADSHNCTPQDRSRQVSGLLCRRAASSAVIAAILSQWSSIYIYVYRSVHRNNILVYNSN
jgi:hypothetical protein